MTWRLRAGVVAATVVFARPVHADAPAPPPPARLVYTRGAGAAECPDEAALRASVAARLGYDPFRPDAPRTVVASLARDHDQLRAAVEVRSATGDLLGQRSLTSRDCGELAGAMTLAISIAVDPLSLTRAPATPAPSAPLAPPPLAPEPLAGKPPAEPIRPRIALGVAGAFGAVPAPTLAGTVAAGLRFRAFSLDLEGRATLPGSTAVAGGGTVSARGLSVWLVPCFHVRWAFACAVGSVGALQGQGTGTGATTDTTLLFGAGARLGVDVPIAGVFHAVGYGEVEAPFPRTILRLGTRDGWSTPFLAGAVAAGLMAEFD